MYPSSSQRFVVVTKDNKILQGSTNIILSMNTTFIILILLHLL